VLSGKKVKFASGTGIQNTQAEKALKLIQKNGMMHKFELMNHLGLTLAQMIPFNSYLKYALQNYADYDKRTQEWVLTKEPTTKEETP